MRPLFLSEPIQTEAPISVSPDNRLSVSLVGIVADHLPYALCEGTLSREQLLIEIQSRWGPVKYFSR